MNSSVKMHPWINPLRGCSALAVLLFHSFGNLEGLPLWKPMEGFRFVFSYGWLGVHAFFVISGYCMFVKMESMISKRKGAAEFLKDRFFRIMPPYWAALFFTVLLGLLSAPFNTSGLAGALPGSWLALFSDILLIQPYCKTQSLLLVSWTLVIEWGFYLLCSSLLGLRNLGFAQRSAIVIALLLSFLSMFDSVLFATFVFDHWPTFCLGMLAAFGRGWKPLSFFSIGTALIFLLFFILRLFSGVESAKVITETTVALILFFPFPSGDPAGRNFLFSILATAGTWSYSIYLIHGPVLSRLGNLSSHFIPATSPLFAFAWLVQIFITLVFCGLFYLWVEKRWEKQRHLQN